MSTWFIAGLAASLPIIALAAIVWMLKRREADRFLQDRDDWGGI